MKKILILFVIIFIITLSGCSNTDERLFNLESKVDQLDKDLSIERETRYNVTNELNNQIVFVKQTQPDIYTAEGPNYVGHKCFQGNLSGSVVVVKRLGKEEYCVSEKYKCCFHYDIEKIKTYKYADDENCIISINGYDTNYIYNDVEEAINMGYIYFENGAFNELELK